jgi:lysylphosphatidylglycerol synthetase-like protein (DUF2156 family)
MRWKIIIRRLHPANLIDCLVDIILSLMEAWAVIRAVIILALVLVTIVVNLQSIINCDFVKELKNENSWIVDWMHDTNK